MVAASVWDTKRTVERAAPKECIVARALEASSESRRWSRGRDWLALRTIVDFYMKIACFV